jgi:hypothetical protein
VELRSSILAAASIAGIEINAPDNVSSIWSSTNRSEYGKGMNQPYLDKPSRCLVENVVKVPKIDVLRPVQSLIISSPTDTATSICFGPRLMPDPFQFAGSASPPADILPFIGAGAYTFAGYMFWSIMQKFKEEVDESRMHGDHAEEGQLVRNLPRINFQQFEDSSNLYWDMKTSFLISVVQTRLEWLNEKKSNYSGNMGKSSVEMMSWHGLQRLVELDYASRGEDVANWLSPMGVEGRLRKVVGDEVFAVLAATAKENMATNTFNAMPILDKLFDKLTHTCVCFGDGPRWNIHVFDRILGDWLNTISNGLMPEGKLVFVG